VPHVATRKAIRELVSLEPQQLGFNAVVNASGRHDGDGGKPSDTKVQAVKMNHVRPARRQPAATDAGSMRHRTRKRCTALATERSTHDCEACAGANSRLLAQGA